MPWTLALGERGTQFWLLTIPKGFGFSLELAIRTSVQSRRQFPANFGSKWIIKVPSGETKNQQFCDCYYDYNSNKKGKHKVILSFDEFFSK